MVRILFITENYSSLSDGGKRTIFLTNTVVLAKQQAEVLEKMCRPLKTAVYTGDMNVDAWRRDRWESEFDDNKVSLFGSWKATIPLLLFWFFKKKEHNINCNLLDGGL